MSQFEVDQEYYEETRRRASNYCRVLHERLKHLRRQVRNLECAFVSSATIKRKCEEEIIPIRTIPNGMTKKKAEAQQQRMTERIKSDAVFRETLRELLRKEGYL